MGKYTGPKCKKCRRIGEKLFLKGDRCETQKCEIVKRNFPPGMHGQKGKGRQSAYGLQLQEKQKARITFFLYEKQFRLTFEKSKKMKGDTGHNFLKLLENRLDNAIYRSGLASSRDQARQLVSHGHFMINGKKVTIPSLQLKSNDIIELKKSSLRSKIFSEAKDKMKKQAGPSWLNKEVGEVKMKVLHLPAEEDLAKNLNPQVIVEYYSR